MIKSPWATSLTRGNNERDMTDRRVKRQRGHVKNRSPSPRTRLGATYPGGKVLRRALAKLSRRQAVFDNLDMKKKAAETRPGSMQ